MSHLEGMINQLVIYIVVVQALLCLVMMIGAYSWFDDSQFDENILSPMEFSASERSALNFFSYFLLLNTILPISL